MVYKRSRKPKAYKSKRTAWKRRGAAVGSSVASTAYTALKIAKQVKALVNVEKKYFDVQLGLSPDSTGLITTLNVPAQGITDSTRIGDSIKCQHISIRGAVANSAVAATDTYTRVIIFEDPQNKVTTVAQLLDYVGSFYTPFSPKAFDTRFQSRVLFDKTFVTTSRGGNNIIHAFDIELPLGHHTQFNAATTTINTGAYKVLTCSNIAAGANVPTLSWQSRMTYTDD